MSNSFTSAATFGGPSRDAQSEAAFNATSTARLPVSDTPPPGSNAAEAAALHGKAASMVQAAGSPLDPPRIG